MFICYYSEVRKAICFYNKANRKSLVLEYLDEVVCLRVIDVFGRRCYLTISDIIDWIAYWGRDNLCEVFGISSSYSRAVVEEGCQGWKMLISDDGGHLNRLMDAGIRRLPRATVLMSNLSFEYFSILCDYYLCTKDELTRYNIFIDSEECRERLRAFCAYHREFMGREFYERRSCSIEFYDRWLLTKRGLIQPNLIRFVVKFSVGKLIY